MFVFVVYKLLIFLRLFTTMESFESIVDDAVPDALQYLVHFYQFYSLIIFFKFKFFQR